MNHWVMEWGLLCCDPTASAGAGLNKKVNEKVSDVAGSEMPKANDA
jgi:hypothetical protein